MIVIELGPRESLGGYVNRLVSVEYENGIIAIYEIDRRGDWHMITRSDV